jgi:hypothetical protein
LFPHTTLGMLALNTLQGHVIPYVDKVEEWNLDTRVLHEHTTTTTIGMCTEGSHTCKANTLRGVS